VEERGIEKNGVKNLLPTPFVIPTEVGESLPTLLFVLKNHKRYKSSVNNIY